MTETSNVLKELGSELNLGGVPLSSQNAPFPQHNCELSPVAFLRILEQKLSMPLFQGYQDKGCWKTVGIVAVANAYSVYKCEVDV